MISCICQNCKARSLCSFLSLYDMVIVGCIRKFAESEPTIAVKYPGDEQYGLVSDPMVRKGKRQHYEWLLAESGFTEINHFYSTGLMAGWIFHAE